MASRQIGVLREQHLHAALKEWYSEEGDLLEVGVDGFVIDLVRDALHVDYKMQ